MDEYDEIDLTPRKRSRYLYIPFLTAFVILFFVCCLTSWPKDLSEWFVAFLIVYLPALIFCLGIHTIIMNKIIMSNLRDYVEIERGMSPYEVVEIMGNDFTKSFGKNTETYVWSKKSGGYAHTNHFGDYSVTSFELPNTACVAVTFEDQKVVSVQARNL